MMGIYLSFGPDVLQLEDRAFSDALAAPQVSSNLKIGKAHREDWQEVSKHSKHNVIPA